MSTGIVLVIFYLCLFPCYQCYLNVVLMHGILASSSDMDKLAARITEAHPGTQIINIEAFDDEFSLENMWVQNEGVYNKIKDVITGPDPVIMICYSQGGLVCRSVLERYEHNVHTFISLSSPQSGQYGDTDYLKYLFPKLVKDTLHIFFYTKAGQDISVGNYWNDPFFQEDYFSKNVFLPLLNNGTQPEFKSNFLKLKQLVLIGGPDDGVITPWQSSQFGFYMPDSGTEVMPYTSQYYYINDSFGLKTLDDAGLIRFHTVPGVPHVTWHDNQTVFDCCIEPYLI